MLLLLVACVPLLSLEPVDGKRLSMKVVKEPTSYGMNLVNQHQAVNQPTLKTRVPPANFSGPPHLQQLMGKCFTKLSNDYKYKFCPFKNVTQHEETLRWNPFNGILGVWQQWIIENNTFVAMLMNDGDSCGERFRSTRVELVCGNQTEIESISEPETCNYAMLLRTPLVCDPRSLLVYPTLSEELQEEWNELEGSLLYGDITQQGYDKRLRSIFLKAGLIVSAEQRHVQKVNQKKAEQKQKLENADFDTLSECQSEFRKLYATVKDLQRQEPVENTTSVSVNTTL